MEREKICQLLSGTVCPEAPLTVSVKVCECQVNHKV